MKLDYNKHYINKVHTKHYYMGHIFDNFQWNEFINGIRVQNISIGNNSIYRIIPEQCERWFNQDEGKTKIVKRCPNKVFYRSNLGGFFCKSCARAISKINDNTEFTRLKNE